MIMRTYLASRILENHLVNLHRNCLPNKGKDLLLRIFTYYTSLKTESYHNLKSKTPAMLH